MKTPSHKDPLAELAAEALALRSLSRYRAARGAVERRDADMTLLPEAPAYREMDLRYAELMRSLTSEEPHGTFSELAYLDLIEAIIIDQLSPNDGPVMTAEEDLCCARQLIHWVQKRANARDIADLVAEERAKAGRRMTAHDGNVTDFPAARIVDPTLAAAQRAKALPESERRYPELPWATRQAVMLLDCAKAACMIDLAKKQLVEARDGDLGSAMLAALGGDMTGDDIGAIKTMLSVLYHALPDIGGDEGDGAA